MLMTAASVCVGLISPALAQTAAGSREVEQTLSLGEIFHNGGFVMYPLAGMSILGLALIIYFFVVLRREQVVPDALRKDVVARIREGALDDVRTGCHYRPCAFSEVTLVALDYVESGDGVDPALLKDVIEGEGSRQAAAMQGQVQYLFDLAVISPMVGLVGTVFGMIHAFHAVALDLAKAKPQLLAGGVSEALIATAAGLIVGIPTMAFYAYFRGRSSSLISQLETAATDVLTALSRKKRA
jgi:biopolymer transport protein ExbB